MPVGLFGAGPSRITFENDNSVRVYTIGGVVNDLASSTLLYPGQAFLAAARANAQLQASKAEADRLKALALQPALVSPVGTSDP